MKAVGFKAGESADDAVFIDPEDPVERGRLLALVEPEDLLKYGMIPEFIGRVPIITSLSPLSIEDMIRVLTEPKDAIIRQYQQYFELDGAEGR